MDIIRLVQKLILFTYGPLKTIKTIGYSQNSKGAVQILHLWKSDYLPIWQQIYFAGHEWFGQKPLRYQHNIYSNFTLSNFFRYFNKKPNAAIASYRFFFCTHIFLMYKHLPSCTYCVCNSYTIITHYYTKHTSTFLCVWGFWIQLFQIFIFLCAPLEPINISRCMLTDSLNYVPTHAVTDCVSGDPATALEKKSLMYSFCIPI